MIVVGVDAHKKTHTAVAAEEPSGKVVAEITVSARANGHLKLMRWAAGIDPRRRFAVEDCRHVSGLLERMLLERGERVCRVPPKMMARQRRTERTRGKSDPIDATAVARAAIANPDLPEATVTGPERDVRLLVDHRETLVSERTALQNRLRWHLHELDPGIGVATGALDRFRVLDALAERVRGYGEGVLVQVALEEIARIRELTDAAKRLEHQIRMLVRRLAPQLLAIPGCAELTAGKIIGEVSGVGRFSSDAKLALHAGAAPLEASSGDRTRHRLNRAGNRQLNAALHRIAVTQLRIHEPAKLYMKRRISEGKTKREALRSLKRHLARVVYRSMQPMNTEDPTRQARAALT
ncbi:MAG: IS110 family transposase [Actinomycetota bacterium]